MTESLRKLAERLKEIKARHEAANDSIEFGHGDDGQTWDERNAMAAHNDRAEFITLADAILAQTEGGGREQARIPARECFWLVERNTSPPQYITGETGSWQCDVWRARRFPTERAAHDYWRMMGDKDRAQFKVVEHLFVNRGDEAPSPQSPVNAEPTFADREAVAQWMIRHSYATGHGDSVADLLSELTWQHAERMAASPVNAELVAALEACATWFATFCPPTLANSDRAADLRTNMCAALARAKSGEHGGTER